MMISRIAATLAAAAVLLALPHTALAQTSGVLRIIP